MVMPVMFTQIMKHLNPCSIPLIQLGKLTRWGFTIQELDLCIHYRPGRANQAANAVYRQPIPSGSVATAVMDKTCIVTVKLTSYL